MLALLRALPTDSSFRKRLAGVYTLIALMNVGAWLWALIAFSDQPVLLGVAVVVYGLGLRHAIDADHIVAIDNVTRKLLQQGQSSVSVGLWFALGHSAVILLATAAVIGAAGSLRHLKALQEVGGLLSAGGSGLFLVLIAITNVFILLAIVRTVRLIRAGFSIDPAELDLLFSGSGVLARLFKPLFRCITRSWHMAPLGFLFGLSFETATEVALFAIAATQTTQGLGIGSALVYPALFAAGMSLLDTTDGVMMVGAYKWAVADPVRKLRYNFTITLMSILVALFIGLIQLGNLATRSFDWEGPAARLVSDLSQNFGLLGALIIALFALAWATSVITFKLLGSGSKLARSAR